MTQTGKVFVAVAILAGAAAYGRAAQAPQTSLAVETVAGAFVCGEDANVPPIPLRWTAVVLAGDARQYQPCPEGNHYPGHREVREGALLGAAKLSPDDEIAFRAAQALARIGRDVGALIPTAVVVPMCRAEVQIFGGLYEPKRWQPGELFRLVRHRNARVRRAAAIGIGVALSRQGIDPDVATAARKEIEACLLTERDREVQEFLLEAMGAARYKAADDHLQVQRYLTDYGRKLNTLGAVKGLEVLLRQAPQLPVEDATRAGLRDLALRSSSARVRILAVAALQAARDTDLTTIDRAAYDREWQVRRIVAGMLNLSDPDQARIGERLAQDQFLQVRYEYLGALSRLATRTRLCAPMLPYLKDPEPTVVLRAMDVLNAQCTDLDPAIDQLTGAADKLGKPESTEYWHLPSRALTALARVRPDEAKKRLESGIKHQVWQVRAAAVTASVSLGEPQFAVELARADSAPNVRTAAIEALLRAKHEDTIAVAIENLKEASDFQLLMTAANAIPRIADERRDSAADVLIAAMQRLTRLGEDPSRDPRVAILRALGRVLRSERSSELLEFTGDFDDAVNEAAAKAFQEVAGSAPPPNKARKRRYPFQPAEGSLTVLPATAVIWLENADAPVHIQLRSDLAPVTVARFVALATAGHYNGLTFHRIVPNFVVQGGSPGANEYVGTARYMRDEVGGPHLYGAVGISTRGRDTGDAQIFIDLVDLPRLDREYTVFGYVAPVEMPRVERMLEGAVIKSVTFK